MAEGNDITCVRVSKPRRRAFRASFVRLWVYLGPAVPKHGLNGQPISTSHPDIFFFCG
jgi:hypothetical protein